MESEQSLDETANQDADLSDRSVRLIQRLTSRGAWRIPSEAFLDIPKRLYKYIETLDPVEDERKFDRAVRLLARLQEQNLARDRQEIQFLAPQVVGTNQVSQEADAIETSPAPQIGYIERPSLRDAAATAKILDDLGILGQIADGSAQGDVIDAESRPSK